MEWKIYSFNEYLFSELLFELLINKKSRESLEGRLAIIYSEQMASTMELSQTSGWLLLLSFWNRIIQLEARVQSVLFFFYAQYSNFQLFGTKYLD